MRWNIQAVTVSVSSAQLLALHDDPIPVLPSFGDGRTIIVLATTCEIRGATVGYTNKNAPDLYYGISSAGVQSDTLDVGAIYNATTQRTNIQVGDSIVTGNTSGIVGKGMVFTDTRNWLTGDGNLLITVIYIISPVPVAQS